MVTPTHGQAYDSVEDERGSEMAIDAPIVFTRKV